MPILTTGGMRSQMTWLPDNIPMLSFKKNKVLSHASQTNLKDLIRLSLKLGMNHFETARMYGTSEMQFAAALNEMIESGEIKVRIYAENCHSIYIVYDCKNAESDQTLR